MAETASQRSALKDFLASIATIKGDLSNITAPPFLLADQSTCEFPAYWAENTATFTAAASEDDPAKRALLVVRWFLASLKRQQYAGRSESDGVKKPLNAFLGELFLAEYGGTKLVSEQVSHHPPITACYLSNDECGVRAQGYACQSITFSGTVNIQQTGHAIVHLDKYNEDHLIPLPNVKVSGLITGTPYPELVGSYVLVSSAGYTSTVDFSGKKLLGLSGKKNHVHAQVHSTGSSEALYTIEGSWNDSFDIFDNNAEKSIETFDVNAQSLAAPTFAPSDLQDPYESRRAWADVISALHKGDMQEVSDAKSKIERAQRAQRERDGDGSDWQRLFFVKTDEDEIFEKLARDTDGKQHARDAEFGFWKFDRARLDGAKKPFHGRTRPDEA